jgi:hypothetical protein
MEDMQNVQEPWCLMTLEKLGKVGCIFYNNVISCHKDKMFFHLGYQQDGNGRVGVATCSKAHSQLKALFANGEGIVF